jgi:hypothetical protein
MTLKPVSCGGGRELWLETAYHVQKHFFIPYCKKFSYQIEDTRCGENPHIQCYINLRSKKRKNELLKILSMDSATAGFRLEPSVDANLSYLYCQKSESRIEGPWNDLLPYVPSAAILFPPSLLTWQQDIDHKIKTCRSTGRKIFWVTDVDGQKGKMLLFCFIFCRLFLKPKNKAKYLF